MRAVAKASLLGLVACAARVPAATEPAAPCADRDVTARGLAASSSTFDPSFLRSYAATRGFRLGTPRDAIPTPDGRAVLFLRSSPRDPKQSLYETDLASGETRLLLAPEALTTTSGAEILSAEERARRERLRITATGFAWFSLSHDGRSVLVGVSGRPWVLDRSTGRARALEAGPGAVIDPRFSPDDRAVAYVRDGELRVVPVGPGPIKERTLTTGASETLTHGLAEFVAQEEFGRMRGFWWSPDARTILYEQADLSPVERITIADPGNPEKAPDRPAYPRAGRANAEIRLGLVKAVGGATVWLEWDRARFPYVVDARWPKAAKGPLITVIDRRQREERLLLADPETGRTTILVSEHDDAWIDVDPSVPKVLSDGTFLWSSESSGTWRLSLHDRDGKPIRTLADVGYRKLLAVDEQAKVAYVAGANDPSEQRIFAVPLDGSAPRPIGPEAPWVSANFGDSSKTYVAYVSDRERRRSWVAGSAHGGPVRTIPSVAEPFEIRPYEIRAVGENRTRVAVLWPRDFVPGKRYAVIDAAYAGPHVTLATHDAATHLRDQWIADATSAIVVKIDAKGTPHRDRAWSRALLEAFDRVPLEGHVDALRALAREIPEIDLDRVGVVGWSFGGYFAALAALKAPDVYKAAVVGAPVVDWRDYDTAYTERYLGLPSERPAVYDAADASTWARRPIAPGAPARPILLFHGTADDNVTFANGLKLAAALGAAGRPFTFVPLLGQTHQLSTAEANEIVWGRAIAFLRAETSAAATPPAAR
jgi:dipeptidyl-peptidase-4